MALFNFRLTPVREVQPWGEPHQPSLHWYGLTLGEQWIDVGKSLLFEVSREFLAKHGGTHFIDYQLARLYEDILEMLPHVLEPVPVDVSNYLHATLNVDWNKRLSAFYERNADEMSAEDEFVDLNVSWMRSRILWSGHFSAPPNIRLWSTSDGLTHIAWEADHCQFESASMWSADSGVHSLPTAQFEQEIDSFHERLLAVMDERIAEIKCGSLAPTIAVDVNELERAQSEHRMVFPRLARKLRPPTDWDAARKAIAIVMNHDPN
jgi:Family of unknown function (DUF5984)